MPAPTLTVKLSGSLLDAPGVATLASAIEALHETAPATRVVLVHGGGPQLDAALSRLDEPVQHEAGLRVTSRSQASVVEATLDQLGHDLATALTQHGHPAVHVSSLEGALVAKTKRAPEGPIWGRVGTPVHFATGALAPPPEIPVVTPVGQDGAGPLNVNADEAAATIAAATGSDHLVLATSVAGVLDAQGEPIGTLTPGGARRLVEDGTATDGMQPKLASACQALSEGVGHVHVTGLTATTLASLVDDAAPAPGTSIATRPGVPA